MLKYFGLNEILYGLKKFAVWIVAITVVFGTAGFINSYTKNEYELVGNDTTAYSASRSYVLEAQENLNNSAQSEENKNCATTAAALLKADFTKQYVYNNLLNDYTEEQIFEYTFNTDSKDKFDFNILEETLNANVLTDSAVVNFYCNTKNKEFSEKVAEYWDQYFNENIVKQIPNLKSCTYVGGTTVQVSDSANEITFSSTSVVKTALVFAIVGFVLSVCAVLAFVLFNPAIATKGDFQYYGISVLDTVKEHGHNNLEFAIDAIILEAQKQNCNSIALVSSIISKETSAKKEDFIKQLNSKDLSFVASNDIFKDYSSFVTTKQSDGVVLLEIKGKSSHKDFSKTVLLLKQHNVNILGVVLI